jgi:preprotein translocase subunit SecF
LRGEVAGLGVGDVSLQEFGNARTILIRLPLPPGDQAAVQRVVGKVQADLKGKYGNVSFRRTESVSGKVSQELIRKGALAVLLSMAAVALFTWFRFEWHFGVSTVVALVHDVTVTLGFFALTQLEFDLNVVAAILTIIGYSLNDKVVIDDRIRENLRKYRQMDIGPIIDLSVNETLPRTVMTSLAMITALTAMLLLGPDVIFGFTAAMLLGIVVGTYSSIFVSSSLLIALGVKPKIEAAPKKTGPSINVERARR